jgi:hypothetical protein
LAKREFTPVPTGEYLPFLEEVAAEDVAILLHKELEYRGSWQRRGGRNAWAQLARKWDRLEAQVLEGADEDLFHAIQKDLRPEGVLDDIGDLRRYLMLVEARHRALRARANRTEEEGALPS